MTWRPRTPLDAVAGEEDTPSQGMIHSVMKGGTEVTLNNTLYAVLLDTMNTNIVDRRSFLDTLILLLSLFI